MKISIREAREHNLKGVDVEFNDGLTVVTGVSGSGKTSLVFDTLYHEARRRFMEIYTLGSSALRLAPARVGSITGLGPSVAVGQNLLNRNPSSTLATASGLHPFFRLMFANFSERSCAVCGTELTLYTEDEIIFRLHERAQQYPVDVFAPLVRNSLGSHRTLLELLTRQFGPDNLRIDKQETRNNRLQIENINNFHLDPALLHTIDLKIGKITGETTQQDIRLMITQAIGLGASFIFIADAHEQQIFPLAPVCPQCGTWFSELRPTHFLVNCIHCSGKGCEQCKGTGMHPQAAEARWHGLRLPELLALSVSQVHALFSEITVKKEQIDAIGNQNVTINELIASSGEIASPRNDKEKNCHCEPHFGEAIPRGQEDPQPVDLRLLHSTHNKERSILPDRLTWEILRRLEALEDVGLGYVSLDRPSPTLSRGEAQRVRLAVALTSRLEDLLHVLDEPTIGQHPADVMRLLPIFRRLGGPVVFVEHDRLAAAQADWAIDLGPGAGANGGQVIYQGTPAGLWQADTPTGRWFSFQQRVAEFPPQPLPKQFLIVKKASLRNLRDIDASIPIGRLTVVSGVSGSGKSTFVEDVLVASLEKGEAVGCDGINGPLLKPFFVDQSPIGINPRSNPATYTHLADTIRDLFSTATGLSPSHFSFNRPEGACPTCQGMGAVEVRMRYLPSSWIPCEDCDGQRFSETVLAAQVGFGKRELSIADFFALSVDEVYPLLINHPNLSNGDREKVHAILQALLDVGLGYLPLGQPSPTLSGGEAQRVKLARCLGKRNLSGQLLVLDEPSTGLHPQDVAGLLLVLHRLTHNQATLVVVEHNTDILRSADWIIDLGPGSGPEGGKLLYSGPPEGLLETPDQATSPLKESLTAQFLHAEADLVSIESLTKSGGINTIGEDVSSVMHTSSGSNVIEVRGARAHNLRNVRVCFPKSALTVVTGVSGSGKSSLVVDVLEVEARRRFLESLSMYERQSTREGPEAPVDEVTGLGVAVTITTERSVYRRRATVGSATELSHHLDALLADLGERNCMECGTSMKRGLVWTCPSCGAKAPIAEPRHFNPSVYAAACLKCHGVGTLQFPVPSKLIIHPEKPLCAGAMYSPGFFPQGYLGKPFNGGYDMVQALARKYLFDPFKTPWNEMTTVAQQAFLFGDPEPMSVHYISRTGREHHSIQRFPGFYGWVGEWDVGGTYTETRPCPECSGGGLRPEYAAVTLAGRNYQVLSEMPLVEFSSILDQLADLTSPEQLRKGTHFTATSLTTARHRAHFLCQVGLGYLHLNRPTGSLSAGEAQRVRLAGLLGSDLTSLTVLLDEPSRGLHSSEVDALLHALHNLRSAGNTVIVVEHDLGMIRGADYLVDMGPGAGKSGGNVVAQGTLPQVLKSDTLTARWLLGERTPAGLRTGKHTEPPEDWLIVRGARANNLRGEVIRFPLHRLTGVCGVSGSGKSTLVIDTLGRVLAPKKQTTSVAYEPVVPGEHDAIEGAPERVIILDQTRRGVYNPADFLELTTPLVKLYSESETAAALGLGEEHFARRCSACGGGGLLRTEMGFLPDIFSPCDLCSGTGFLPEAWEVKLNSLALPEVFNLTIDEVFDLFAEQAGLGTQLQAARQVGLGYLVLRQPGYALSGGEAQRLKIAHELSRKASLTTLYILDEPTVGQHLEDVARLVGVLRRLVEAGHSVLVVEHHPLLLACCDWLVELGPGGGPQGGWLIAAGTAQQVATGATPTAVYLREILEASS
jgi:excinuclease ABC subunit A